MNPVEAALQQQAMGLQLKQIEAQNKLASAETAKTLAEAKPKEEQLNQIQLETTSRVRLRTLYAKRADVNIYIRFLKPKKRSTHIAYYIK